MPDVSGDGSIYLLQDRRPKMSKFVDKATVGQQVLHITYEQLVATPERAIQNVCTFLCVPRGERKLAQYFAKQTSTTQRGKEDVANLDELIAAFRGTRHQWASAI
eukprot:scaffold322473_cov28-Tisochrysis_lutea.AAC.1